MHCMRCTWSFSQYEEGELGEQQRFRMLCGFCAAADLRAIENRKNNLARKAELKQQHGRFAWWWRRVFLP